MTGTESANRNLAPKWPDLDLTWEEWTHLDLTWEEWPTDDDDRPEGQAGDTHDG